MKDPQFKETRAIEAEIEIGAPADAVWRALTDAEELSRWFALEAKVENPGEGGTVWISWGPGFQGESRIEIWEPDKRYRARDIPAKREELHEPAYPSRAPISLAWELEGQGGKTLLKLVHSGFGSGADWDDEFNNTKTGWSLFLLNLRHYLERHRGQPAVHLWDFISLNEVPSFDALWKKLLGPSGLASKGRLEGVGVGDVFSVTTLKGDVLEGRVDAHRPPKVLGVTLSNWNDALLRLSCEQMKGMCFAGLELVTWGVAREESEALCKHVGELVRAAAVQGGCT